jgi:hypothetical protein
MKTLIIALALALSACTTVVPVTVKFPEPPGLQSQTPCPQLQKLQDNPQLSDVAKTVADNYTEYYTCAVKLDAWQEWYRAQKIIFEGLNK